MLRLLISFSPLKHKAASAYLALQETVHPEVHLQEPNPTMLPPETKEKIMSEKTSDSTHKRKRNTQNEPVETVHLREHQNLQQK